MPFVSVQEHTSSSFSSPTLLSIFLYRLFTCFCLSPLFPALRISLSQFTFFNHLLTHRARPLSHPHPFLCFFHPIHSSRFYDIPSPPTSCLLLRYSFMDAVSSFFNSSFSSLLTYFLDFLPPYLPPHFTSLFRT